MASVTAPMTCGRGISSNQLTAMAAAAPTGLTKPICTSIVAKAPAIDACRMMAKSRGMLSRAVSAPVADATSCTAAAVTHACHVTPTCMLMKNASMVMPSVTAHHGVLVSRSRRTT